MELLAYLLAAALLLPNSAGLPQTPSQHVRGPAQTPADDLQSSSTHRAVGHEDDAVASSPSTSSPPPTAGYPLGSDLDLNFDLENSHASFPSSTTEINWQESEGQNEGTLQPVARSARATEPADFELSTNSGLQTTTDHYQSSEIPRINAPENEITTENTRATNSRGSRKPKLQQRREAENLPRNAKQQQRTDVIKLASEEKTSSNSSAQGRSHKYRDQPHKSSHRGHHYPHHHNHHDHHSSHEHHHHQHRQPHHDHSHKRRRHHRRPHHGNYHHDDHDPHDSRYHEEYDIDHVHFHDHNHEYKAACLAYPPPPEKYHPKHYSHRSGHHDRHPSQHSRHHSQEKYHFVDRHGHPDKEHADYHRRKDYERYHDDHHGGHDHYDHRNKHDQHGGNAHKKGYDHHDCYDCHHEHSHNHHHHHEHERRRRHRDRHHHKDDHGWSFGNIFRLPMIGHKITLGISGGLKKRHH